MAIRVGYKRGVKVANACQWPSVVVAMSASLASDVAGRSHSIEAKYVKKWCIKSVENMLEKIPAPHAHTEELKTWACSLTGPMVGT
jgi:hypothetical protein